MQTAANEPTITPQRDIDTIILEARHLLGTSKPLEPGKRRVYPHDPVTIAKVLALREESGLARERFCERVHVGPATMWCWEEGQTGGGKPWLELLTILVNRKAQGTSAVLNAPASSAWEISPSAPSDLGRQPPRSTDLMGEAGKRLERLREAFPAPKVTDAQQAIREGHTFPSPLDRAVGVAFPMPQIAPKIVDDRPTAEDLQHGVSGVEQAVVSAHFEPIDLPAPPPRIKGADLIAARDAAYAAFQSATDRMPAAEGAADLVTAYRRSHRGLPGFCRGHYDAETMAKRLEQWTAGCDEDGEQWDRLIGLLTLRGIKSSKNGLGKRTAKAQRAKHAAGDRLYASAEWQHAANNPPPRYGMYMGHEQGDSTDRYPVRWTKSGWRSPNGTSLIFGSPGRDDMWCEIVIRSAIPADAHQDEPQTFVEFARPVAGWIDLEDRFSKDKDAAIARSWDIQVQRAADALIAHAMTANTSLHLHLTSPAAREYVTALSRMLEGREAHQRSLE